MTTAVPYGMGELKWEDVDFDNRTITVSRSMEYRHSVKEWRIGEPKRKCIYFHVNIPPSERAALFGAALCVLGVKIILRIPRLWFLLPDLP